MLVRPDRLTIAVAMSTLNRIRFVLEVLLRVAVDVVCMVRSLCVVGPSAEAIWNLVVCRLVLMTVVVPVVLTGWHSSATCPCVTLWRGVRSCVRMLSRMPLWGVRATV